MNYLASGTCESRARHRLVLKSSVAVLAAAGLLSAFPVLAQDTSAAPAAAAEAPAPAAADTTPAPAAIVTVTGVRRAAQTAQKIKQDSDNVIDSIVADDIGKFPDTNVAQTLARVSGIQVRRDAGEANTVLIRGLPGIATLLNGREMFTTTGRYIKLADIPSAMLQRADVYKSQSADQVEGGIAGVIDVRTNRPFDFKDFTASAQVGAKNKDKAKATDPELSGMVSNRWKTDIGEVGALFGVSSVKDRFHEERAFQTFPIDKSFAAPNLTGPDLVGLQDIYGQRKRQAANFALQWKPNADLEVYAEGLHSVYKNTDETDFFVGLPWATSADQIKVTKIPGTNQTDTITSTNAFTILSARGRESTSTASQYAIGANWRVSPGLRATTELATTRSKYDWVNPILDTNLNVENVFVKTNVNGGAFAQYQSPSLNDPSKIFLSQFFDRYGRDRGKSAKLARRRDLHAGGGWLLQGVRRRSASQRAHRQFDQIVRRQRASHRRCRDVQCSWLVVHHPGVLRVRHAAMVGALRRLFDQQHLVGSQHCHRLVGPQGDRSGIVLPEQGKELRLLRQGQSRFRPRRVSGRWCRRRAGDQD